MSYHLVLVFDGVTEEDYWAVNDRLGINRDGSGDWPEGLEYHTAGPRDGGIVIIESWRTKADHERFLADRLGPALAAGSVPPPSSVIDTEPFNTFMPAVSSQ